MTTFGRYAESKPYADYACALFEVQGENPEFYAAPGYTLYADPDAG